MSDLQKTPMLTKKATKRKAKVWPHKCFKDANEQLSEHNTKLTECLLMSLGMKKMSDLHSEPCFATEKINTKLRKGPRTVFFSYCPICGKKLR